MIIYTVRLLFSCGKYVLLIHPHVAVHVSADVLGSNRVNHFISFKYIINSNSFINGHRVIFQSAEIGGLFVKTLVTDIVA